MTDSLQTNVQMLIRRPAAEVFEAFINPDITTQFWFTRSSGRLVAGQRVTWNWEMYGASADVDVIAVEPNKRIRIEWDDGLPVEWQFEPRGIDQTFVTITATGFKGTTEEVAAQVIDSTGGFTMVVCALKALLEHGIRLNVVADRAPDANIHPQ